MGNQTLAGPWILSRYRGKIERGLREFVANFELPLYRMVRYHLGFEGQPQGYGGKALRPSLLLLAHEALGGEPEGALRAAIAVELAHNFSLVHDDIQDRDEERHGRPTVWQVAGEAQAINVGDALRELSALALISLQEGFPPETVLQASQVLNRAVLEMIEGQYLDLSFEGRLDITVQDYLGMIERKTGALLGAALEIGALLAGTDGQIVRSCESCGRKLGCCFQIRDDLLGIWGDQIQTGKSTASDILRRKKSLPIVYALNGEHGNKLRAIYRRPPAEADLSQVLEILERVGAREEAEALAGEYCNQALAELEGAELPQWAWEGLEELVQFLLRRKH